METDFRFYTRSKLDDFLPNLQRNKNQILFGYLSEKINERIPPKIRPNCEPCKEDFYWQARLEKEEWFAHLKLQRPFNESPEFTQDHLPKNLLVAPRLQPFYFNSSMETFTGMLCLMMKRILLIISWSKSFDESPKFSPDYLNQNLPKSLQLSCLDLFHTYGLQRPFVSEKPS